MAQLNSVAYRQFPQIVWRKGDKRLWNPVHRKALKNLPEERVRLRILEYLIQGGWSKHRVSTEEAIDLPQKKTKLRTDLICYTNNFSPYLLVECKAENIKLSGKTARQIARYNQQVQAPFMLLTNGQTDYWYNVNQTGSVTPLKKKPDLLPDPTMPDLNFNFWVTRGFAGKKAAPALRSWLPVTINRFLKNDNMGSIRYLSFNNSPTDTNLSNYYRILSIASNRIAFSFTTTEFGGSRFICILNREGKNEALMEINLDILFDDRSPNTFIYQAGGTKSMDIQNHVDTFSLDTITPQKFTADLHTLLVDSVE